MTFASADLRPREGASIEEAYATYRPALLAHLTRLVSDAETAEDLCQETFVKALSGWSGRDPAGSVAAWLYRIATNTAYDHLRRRRRIRFIPLDQTLEPTLGDERGMESRFANREPVQRALEQLPAQYRVPLVQHACEGRHAHEIAAGLGCSSNAVKTRLFRARERFRQVYQA